MNTMIEKDDERRSTGFKSQLKAINYSNNLNITTDKMRIESSDAFNTTLGPKINSNLRKNYVNF
jgi:hypothetical protein